MHARYLDERARARLLSTARARIWRAARVLRRFTIRELAEVASATRANAFDYVAGLERVGLIAVAFRPRNGSHWDGPTIYILVRDCGPLPPVARESGGILDFNLSPTGVPSPARIATLEHGSNRHAKKVGKTSGKVEVSRDTSTAGTEGVTVSEAAAPTMPDALENL